MAAETARPTNMPYLRGPKMTVQDRQFRILQPGLHECQHGAGNTHVRASNHISYTVKWTSCGMRATVWHRGADIGKPKDQLIAEAVQLVTLPTAFE
jgi:hypothetical protein